MNNRAIFLLQITRTTTGQSVSNNQVPSTHYRYCAINWDQLHMQNPYRYHLQWVKGIFTGCLGCMKQTSQPFCGEPAPCCWLVEGPWWPCPSALIDREGCPACGPSSHCWLVEPKSNASCYSSFLPGSLFCARVAVHMVQCLCCTRKAMPRLT